MEDVWWHHLDEVEAEVEAAREAKAECMRCGKIPALKNVLPYEEDLCEECVAELARMALELDLNE